MNEQLMLATLQFALCTAIGVACLCRINLMRGKDTLLFYRFAYSAMLGVATACGFSPLLLHEWPNRSSVLMSAGVLIVVCAGLKNWRGGAPAYTQKEPRP